MTTRYTELLEQAKTHYEADMLLKGTYGRMDGDSFKGCSVGCHIAHIRPAATPAAINNLKNKHRIVADYYGYPEWLALLQDIVFEGLPDSENRKWHVQLAEVLAARTTDIDWTEVFHRVHVGILRISYRIAGAAQKVVQHVLDLHERAAAGETISDKLWQSAESAAEAAEAAAWSVAEAAAEAAARSAAWSASVAEAAAEAAARSAAWSASAAEAAAYQEIRDIVLAVLAE